MKRIELYLLPAELDRTSLDERQIVVVDVLRTCTSIAMALWNGAAKVIPVETVEEATRLAATLDAKSKLLCGEREGRKVNGFDLGNSPREYTRARVDGATLVFASTNASPLMAGILGGREQYLVAYVNLNSISKTIGARRSDVAIVCAGRNGRFSLEDAACAGALIHHLTRTKENLELNDAAVLARDYHREHGLPPEAVLRRCGHGRYLIDQGFEEDIPLCAAIDSVPVVPLLKEGRIAALANSAAPASR